jgi:hypothetical protein
VALVVELNARGEMLCTGMSHRKVHAFHQELKALEWYTDPAAEGRAGVIVPWVRACGGVCHRG